MLILAHTDYAKIQIYLRAHDALLPVERVHPLAERAALDFLQKVDA